MTPAEIKRLLAEERIQLTKSLGQNFLHDPNQLRRIVAAAELAEKDRILEIGPGLGALTQVLLERVPHVLAIEKDNRLFACLRKQIPDERRLTLIHADALEFLRSVDTDWTDWKVVSNLPYSVASPILVDFAKVEHPPERITATLQLEVAQRLAATAGNEHYGVLSLLVQLRYIPAIAFKIPPSCFYPAPEVESACVTLRRRENPLLPRDLARDFEKIVKRGFSQRRKMMLKLLKADWPMTRLEKALARLEISPQARAESLSLEHFVKLTRLLRETDAMPC